MKPSTLQSIVIALLCIIAILLGYFIWSINSNYVRIRRSSEDTAYYTRQLVEMFADREIVEMQEFPFIPYK